MLSSASRKRSEAKNGIYRLREKVCAKDGGYREKKLYIEGAKNGVYELRRNEFSRSHQLNQKEVIVGQTDSIILAMREEGSLLSPNPRIETITVG